MCGRFTLTDPDPRILRARFRLEESVEIEEEPRYNIAPTDPVLAIRDDSKGRRRIGRLQWGLIPFFSKGERPHGSINARAETVEKRSNFREPFRKRRCLIPADGFYEWRDDPSGKQPVWISREDGEPFAFAGVWDGWKTPAGGLLMSCAIVTCDANDLVRSVHDRMPVILPREEEDRWVSRESKVDEVRELLRPREWPGLTMREVNRAVNDVKNDGPELLDPPEEPTQPTLLEGSGR